MEKRAAPGAVSPLKGAAMLRVGILRMGTVVIAMEVAAVIVAVLTFGWPMLLVGVPLLVGTLVVLVVVGLTEEPRRKLQAHRAARHLEPAPQGGLMSGFFEIPRQTGPVEVPRQPAPQQGAHQHAAPQRTAH